MVRVRRDNRARVMETAAARDGHRSALLRLLARARTVVSSLLARLERVRPLYVVGAFVLVEWCVTLGLALTVRHNGWIYYQGGDQVWFYTTSWLLAHAQLPPTSVGYGFSILLFPLTLVGGPNLLHVLPAVVLMNVFVLMPAAMAAMYGIGERLRGRLFGYWVLVVWIVTPLVGIRFTNVGFHQEYTEISLPQAFGLTALSDFPSMAMLAVGAYFLVRAMQRPTWQDCAFAGLFSGFAIGIKPSSGLFLLGVGLALVIGRHWRTTAGFAAAIAPSVIALTVWKWRGLGYLPLFHAEHAVRLALGSAGIPLAATGLGKYLYFNWGHLQSNLDSIQEHFWSLRVFEWLVIAGVIALARIRLRMAALFGGWFLAFALIKGSDPLGNIQDTSLLRMLIPAIPAFVLMLAALPLLVPAVAHRLQAPAPPSAWRRPRATITLVAAALLLFAAVPVALSAIASPTPASSTAYVNVEAGPIPTDPSLHLTATVDRGRVDLTWQDTPVAAGRVFYRVVRGSDCSPPVSMGLCQTTTTVAATPDTTSTDAPGSGTYLYTLEVAANWLDEPTGGDPYVASLPVVVKVP